jgi:hypothetical protein
MRSEWASCNDGNVNETPAAPTAYLDAGVQHGMAALQDRQIGTHLKTDQRFCPAGAGR